MRPWVVVTFAHAQNVREWREGDKRSPLLIDRKSCMFCNECGQGTAASLQRTSQCSRVCAEVGGSTTRRCIRAYLGPRVNLVGLLRARAHTCTAPTEAAATTATIHPCSILGPRTSMLQFCKRSLHDGARAAVWRTSEVTLGCASGVVATEHPRYVYYCQK
jgi:hypothetical protein